MSEELDHALERMREEGTCPVCEGFGNLAPSSLEPLLRAIADKLGYRLGKKPAERTAAPTDWTPVIEALSAAREALGLGAAVWTGSARQRKWLAVGTVEQWIAAIEGQRDSLRKASAQNRATKDQVSAWMSLETISRNWERCLQNASKQASQYKQLDDGRWVELRGGTQRLLSPSEMRSLGLEPT